MSTFSILFANAVAVIIMGLVAMQFISQEQEAMAQTIQGQGWIPNVIAFGFAIITLNIYIYPLFKTDTHEKYRKRVLNLPIVVGGTTLTSWLLAFISSGIIFYVNAEDNPAGFILRNAFFMLSVGIVAFVISYFYQDFFNRRYLIPALFNNHLEEYKAIYQPSLRMKFGIYYLAIGIAPLIFFAWVITWIYSQTGAISETQLWYLALYGAFVIFAGIELTSILSRTLHLPLVKAKYATTKIKEGNYDIALEVNSTDEVGVLSERINLMAHTLKEDQKEILALNQEIEATQKEVVFTMGAIGESRSKETGNHVKRVAEYSKLLALKYGLSPSEAELLKQASPMHDIGKVAIPDNILNKPAKFTPEEFEVMKNHASLGFEMLQHSDRELLRAAAIVAYEHHEKWDGSGYPRGVAGEAIHIYGRITAVADVFDALGSDRVYKKAWEDERIFTLFKEERGKHFDPHLVDLFFENIDAILAIRAQFKDNYIGEQNG
jgi:response regulator RpfG family c-di-GMP phosphodiesterase